MPFYHYELQAHDFVRPLAPNAAVATGGAIIVTTAGTGRKATLYNPDTYVALANPVSFVRGKARFATLDTIASVDVYGVAPTGHAIAMRGVRPGAETEVFLRTQDTQQMLQVPFFAGDYAINAEVDTGLDMPIGAIVQPTVSIRVTAIDATEDLEVGLLSSESGGDTDGFLDNISVANLGTVVPNLNSTTPTTGALLFQGIATTPAVNLPRAHGIGVARSLVFLFSAGSDTGEGFVQIPYVLPAL